jgi:glutamate transport system permease protein
MSDTTVLYDFPGPRARKRQRWASLLGAVALAAIVLWALAQLARAGQLEADKWVQFTDPAVLKFLAGGLLANFTAAILAGTAALLLGLLLALGRLAPSKLISIPVTGYVEFIRGIPPLLLLFFLFFGLPAYHLNFSVFWVLVIGIALYNAALFAEIIRAGILALPRGQSEAGLALGLTARQNALRIVLPQAVTAMTPALLSQMVVLFKDTTLGQLITYEELLRRGRINAQVEHGTDLQNLLVVAVIFIAVNLVFSLCISWIERRRRQRPIRVALSSTSTTTSNSLTTLERNPYAH